MFPFAGEGGEPSELTAVLQAPVKTQPPEVRFPSAFDAFKADWIPRV